VLAIDAAYANFVNRNDYEPGMTLVDWAENVVMPKISSSVGRNASPALVAPAA
jgi:histidinol-phosphate aminotransferase